MMEIFPTSWDAIQERLQEINPIEYGTTRNYLRGAVSRLSPYISRGVIGLSDIKNQLLNQFSLQQAKPFLQQLAWREYFQRVWWELGDSMQQDIKHPQPNVLHHQIPVALIKGNTGIDLIDSSIHQLMESGYVHNHARMYIAMLTCNLGGAHWKLPAKWMYYHLLDGDIASNTLSWQWVAGSFSNKKYYANQDNINHYSGTTQANSYLQQSYEALPQLLVPEQLQSTKIATFSTCFPETKPLTLDYQLPLALYTSYQLNPRWLSEQSLNRVLILAPSHFTQFPVSEKVLSFIIALAKNLIPDMQILVGEVEDIPGINKFPAIHYQEHPLTQGFPGSPTPATWMFPKASYQGKGFFGFWKQCEKSLYAK
ncbi:MAG: FAD-binding domain-containing protein [Chitinophagia bacterium]|jgi:deoxyribodipyrimidine photo-lyase